MTRAWQWFFYQRTLECFMCRMNATDPAASWGQHFNGDWHLDRFWNKETYD